MGKLVPVEKIENKIFHVRGKKVMLDKGLVELYGVPTKILVQAVRRNRGRFPRDFMYQLTGQEVTNLRSQFVTSSWGGRRYLPYAFTEQGVAMLSSVLNSKRAIQTNIQIMRAFVNLRRIGLTYAQFKIVFQAIKRLLEPSSSKKKRRIGFHS